MGSSRKYWVEVENEDGGWSMVSGTTGGKQYAAGVLTGLQSFYPCPPSRMMSSALPGDGVDVREEERHAGHGRVGVHGRTRARQDRWDRVHLPRRMTEAPQWRWDEGMRESGPLRRRLGEHDVLPDSDTYPAPGSVPDLTDSGTVGMLLARCLEEGAMPCITVANEPDGRASYTVTLKGVDTESKGCMPGYAVAKALLLWWHHKGSP